VNRSRRIENTIKKQCRLCLRGNSAPPYFALRVSRGLDKINKRTRTNPHIAGPQNQKPGAVTRDGHNFAVCVFQLV
jgi:hypothetical protein